MPTFTSQRPCKRIAAYLLAGLMCSSWAFPTGAAETTENTEFHGEEEPPAIELGSLDEEVEDSTGDGKEHLGLVFQSSDGRFRINPWLRGQFRFSDPLDDDLRDTSQLDDLPGPDFELRRARLKVEGHLFSPRIGFYYEHELSGEHPLLDLRLDLEFRPDLLARIGQYKVLYNRERIDSSGKQQFVERSISTYAFTVDRQIGATIGKHFAPGSRGDSWLMLGVFEGDGRDPDRRGDAPMWVARWQWQFLGENLPFSQSDLKFRETPAASLSFAAARVRGPYTRFSSSGGGQLSGFEDGGDERYTLEQYLQEFAWHYRGWSIQQEYHIKHIEDHESGLRSELNGGYAQIGKAWRNDNPTLPFTWELAFRLARVDWDNTPADRTQREYSLVANVFFSGQNNKLSVELSRLQLKQLGQAGVDETRLQLQWDVSF